jgi:UDP-glucose 4-epimerase
VVYASSAAVYGDQAALPLDEACPLAPLGPYGADKAGSELHARAAARVHGGRSLGLRFFNVYGPRQRPDDAYAGVITAFATRIRAGEGLTVHGDGRQTRDFVFVADVAAACLRAMAALEAARDPCAEICNVATGVGTSILELAAVLGELLGREVPVTHGHARAGDIRHSVGATARLREFLGFVPQTALRAGLARTLEAAPRPIFPSSPSS